MPVAKAPVGRGAIFLSSRLENRRLRLEQGIDTRCLFLETIMPILAFMVCGLAMLHGWLWSMDERRKAVQAAYDEIRDEVRRERFNR